MRKKLLTFLCAIAASIGPIFANGTKVGDLNYVFDDEKQTAFVTWQELYYEVYVWDNYSGLTDVVIPSTIEYNNKSYTVVGIGESAFRKSKIESVIIPNTVTFIGGGAFYDCYALTSVTIGNSVTSIGEEAFYACSRLTSVTIPNSVTSIGDGAFADCYSLTSVTIPNSVTSIGDYAFWGCSGLTSVEIPNSVTSIGSSAFRGCSSLTSVTIPNSVTSIRERAFMGCRGLTSVTIPNSVTSIGEDAFLDVNNIIYSGTATGSPWGAKCVNGYVDGYLVYSDDTKTTLLGCSAAATGEIVIPNSVTSIGDNAFYKCSSLTSIEIPNSVTSIGDYAFDGCTGLTSLTIPNSVTSIGDYTFYYCSGLTSVTIPNSVTSIGSSAFSSCSSLTSVTIPNSVTSIGDYTFYYCSGLTSVVWNAKNCNEYNFGDQVTSFSFGDSVEIIPANLCKGMNQLTSVTIPNSVTSIGEDAFSGCYNITSVVWNAKNCNSYNFGSQVTSFTFGNEVEVIPGTICSGMYKLTSVTIPNSVTSIGSSAFDGCSILAVIYVPCGELERFKQLLSNDNRIHQKGKTIDYLHLIQLLSDTVKGKIIIDFEPNDCDSLITISAVPNSGYSFLKWSDGSTEVQRSIKLTEEPQKVGAIFHYETVHLSYLATGGTGLGKMTTDNSNVWSYNSQYGAYASKQGGATGNLFTPATDMSMARKITLSFQHAHKFAGTPSEEFTLWVTKDFQGTWDDSEWQQLTISPYSNNTSWAFYNVSIEVPTTCVGTNTVFAFRYKSTQSNYGTWEIKNLKITLEDDGKYEIVDESDQTMGHVAGVGLYDYLTTIELTANPEYGYHFTQWSDGSTDNPRIIELTSDTTFAAEFAIDKSGVCGDENLLTWDYDQENKRLAISGTGTLNSNYTYGSEAPNEVETLIISNGVTSIGSEAFKGFGTLKSVEIANSVTTIGVSAFENCTSLETLSLGENVSQYGEKAFAGCPNIVSIFNYRPRPSKLGTDVFKDVDYFECTLYVLAGSVDMYKSSGSDWKDFFFIEPIGAESIITEDVKVTPHDNTVDIIWPSVNEANTYEIEITKDGEAFCRLIFNAQGQLTSIAFAPSRANVAQQAQTAGFSFTVTGLTSGTTYGYSVTAANSASEVLDTKQGSFTTTGGIATAVDNTNVETKPTKVIRYGQLFILRDGNTYTVQGQQVK